MQPIRVILICGSVLFVLGCGGGGSSAPAVTPQASVAAPMSASKMPRVDKAKLLQDSPDNAVKSWWAAFDQVDARNTLLCEEIRRTSTEWTKENLQPILTPALVDVMGTYLGGCAPPKYKRRVDEVKIESETRSLVFATVWIDQPDPAEKVSAEDLAEWRAGTRFKYVTEKTSGKWFISEVFRHLPAKSYRPEGWDRVYENTPPGFISGVYRQ